MSNERIRNIALDLKRQGAMAELLEHVRKEAVEEAVRAGTDRETLEGMMLVRAIDRIYLRLDTLVPVQKPKPNNRIA